MPNRNKLLRMKGKSTNNISRLLKKVPSSGYFKGLFVEHKNNVSAIIGNCKDIPKSNYELAKRLFYSGDYAKARFRFTLVQKFAPKRFPLVDYYMGRILLMGYDTLPRKIKRGFLALINSEQEVPLIYKEEEAIQCFRKTLQVIPQHIEARFFLNVIEAPEKIDYIPLSIIKEIYQLDAREYHDFLNQSEYDCYAGLIDAVSDSLIHNNSSLAVADLGCATGFAGKYIKKSQVVRQLDGVDISPVMVNYCKQRKHLGASLYSNLVCMDMKDFLTDKASVYDIVMASDVLNMVGGLDGLFEQTYKALKPNGLLAFNINPNIDNDRPFVFDPSMSIFTHHHDYVVSCLEKTGFSICNALCLTMSDGMPAIQYIARKL